MCCPTSNASPARFAQAGQATVEAAFALPVLFVMILLLVQPGIILYDRMVMESAAAEACRAAATAGPASGMGDARLEELVRRHLGAIPEHELFHSHDGGCSWDIRVEGGEGGEVVSVAISNRLKPLPLLGAAASLLGASDARGCLSIKVSRHARTQPAWAASAGIDPASWVGQRG